MTSDERENASEECDEELEYAARGCSEDGLERKKVCTNDCVPCELPMKSVAFARFERTEERLNRVEISRHRGEEIRGIGDNRRKEEIEEREDRAENEHIDQQRGDEARHMAPDEKSDPRLDGRSDDDGGQDEEREVAQKPENIRARDDEQRGNDSAWRDGNMYILIHTGILAYSLLFYCYSDAFDDFGNGEAFLFARVAMAKCDGIFEFWLFAECIEINRDAEGRADLVLAAIALADIAVIVPGDCGMHLFEFRTHFSRAFATSSGLFFNSGETIAFTGAILGASARYVRISPPSSSSRYALVRIARIRPVDTEATAR